MRSPRNLGRLFTASMLTLLATGAQANLLIEDGSGGKIPGKNERPNAVLGDSTATSPAGYGANLYVDGPTTLEFTFTGKEAAYKNQFFVDGSLAFDSDNYPNTVGDTVTYTGGQSGSTQPLPFRFDVDVNGPNSASVENGNNFNDNPVDGEQGEEVNFFVAQETAEEGSGIFLALDDTGGSDDDNHDDMVVEVHEVPAPAPLALLGLGLVGLGIGGYRRR